MLCLSHLALPLSPGGMKWEPRSLYAPWGQFKHSSDNSFFVGSLFGGGSEGKGRVGEQMKAGKFLERFAYCRWTLQLITDPPDPLAFSITSNEVVNSLETEFHCKHAVQYLWRPLWIINGLLQLWKLSHKSFCKLGTRHSNALAKSIAEVGLVCKDPQRAWLRLSASEEREENPSRSGLWIFNSSVPLWFIAVVHQAGHSETFSHSSNVLVGLAINKALKRRCHQSLRWSPKWRGALKNIFCICILFVHLSFQHLLASIRKV